MITPPVEGSLAGSEGRIHFRRWDPIGSRRRIVVLVHGYAEHGGRYTHVATALTERGAVVYAPDHIGHGRSDGERAVITDFEHVVDDICALLDLAEKTDPDLPIVVIGHSMGGLLTARLAQRSPNRIAGVGFCGAVLGDWQWARDAVEASTIPETPFDPLALSRDPTVGAAYAADPLVYHGPYHRRLLVAELEALDRFAEQIDRITMPVLFVHGTADPFVPYARSLQAVEEMASPDVTVHLYRGARHEALNEVNRSEVIGRLVDWVDRFGS